MSAQVRIRRLRFVIVYCCHILFDTVALLSVLLVPVIKTVENSAAFRQTPKWIAVRDWFAASSLPFSGVFQEKTMKVYFYIIPCMLTSLFVWLKMLLPPKGSAPTLYPLCVRRIHLRLRASLDLCFIFVYLLFNVSLLATELHHQFTRTNAASHMTFLTGRVGSPLTAWQCVEQLGVDTGVLALVNLAWWIFLPIGRKSVLLEILKLSWEQAIKFHRWIGYSTVFLTGLHFSIYIAVWVFANGSNFDPQGVMLRNNLLLGACSGCDAEQLALLRQNVYGVLAFVCMVLMTIFSLDIFRRKYFELFWYVHHLFLLVLLFTCLHSIYAMVYVVPGMCWYGLDKLLSLLASRDSHNALITLVGDSIVAVQIQAPPASRNFQAGQYIFCAFPELSALQWHPFSLTSAPHEPVLTFHIKVNGDWTAKLFENAGDIEVSHANVKIKLDGYYGGPVDALQSRTAVVLIGGGIGVTPLLSIAKDLCHRSSARVFLLWAVTSLDELRVFSEDLCRAKVDHGPQLTVHLWITREGLPRQAVAERCLRHIAGRDTSAGNRLSRLPGQTCHISHILSRKTHALMSCAAVLMGATGMWASEVITRIDYFKRSVEAVYEYAILLDFFLVLGCLLVFLAAAMSGGALYRRKMKKSPAQTTFELVDVGMDLDPAEVQEALDEMLVRYEPDTRPDIPDELRRIRSALHKSPATAKALGGPLEVPVIVCGSASMAEAAKTQCKIPASDKEIYFSLKECEEWKW